MSISAPVLGQRLRSELRASVAYTAASRRWFDPEQPDPLDYALTRWGWPVRVAPLLDVCPALAHLPRWQLMLAEDVAHTSGRPVIVMAFPLCERAHGLIHVGDDATVIYLDPDRARDDDALAWIMSHELAHALDPRFLDYRGTARERFAYDLAARLLALQPETVADAAVAVAIAAYDLRGAVRLLRERLHERVAACEFLIGAATLEAK